MQSGPSSESRLIAEKQYYAGLAIAGADYPDQPGAEVVAVFGLTDPQASGGIFREDGSFTKWERPVVAYSGDMLNVLNSMGETIGGDPAIAGQALEEMRGVQRDFDARAALPKAVDLAIEHKIELEGIQQRERTFGKRPAAEPAAASVAEQGPSAAQPESRTVYKQAFGRKGVPDNVTPVMPTQEKRTTFGKRKSAPGQSFGGK